MLIGGVLRKAIEPALELDDLVLQALDSSVRIRHAIRDVTLLILPMACRTSRNSQVTLRHASQSGILQAFSALKLTLTFRA